MSGHDYNDERAGIKKTWRATVVQSSHEPGRDQKANEGKKRAKVRPQEIPRAAYHSCSHYTWRIWRLKHTSNMSDALLGHFATGQTTAVTLTLRAPRLTAKCCSVSKTVSLNKRPSFVPKLPNVGRRAISLRLQNTACCKPFSISKKEM